MVRAFQCLKMQSDAYWIYNMKAEYSMDRVKLEHVNEKKDLGVIIS